METKKKKRYIVGMHIETFAVNMGAPINGAAICPSEVAVNWHRSGDVDFVVFYRPDTMQDSGVHRIQPTRMHPSNFPDTGMSVTFLPIHEIATTAMDVFYCNSIQHWSRWVWLPNTRVIAPLHAMNIPTAEFHGAFAYAAATASHDQHMVVTGSEAAHKIACRVKTLVDAARKEPSTFQLRREGLPCTVSPIDELPPHRYERVKPWAMFTGRWQPSIKVDPLPLLKQVVEDGLFEQLYIVTPQMPESALKMLQNLNPEVKVRRLSHNHRGLRDKLYQECDVLLAPSTNYQENYGMVTQEGLAAGMRVVASRIGGYIDQLSLFPDCKLVANKPNNVDYSTVHPEIWVDDEINQTNKPSVTVDLPAWRDAVASVVYDWHRHKFTLEELHERQARLAGHNNAVWMTFLETPKNINYRLDDPEYQWMLRMMDLYCVFKEIY